MIWLVHPLQTQCVTYVIQRGESLMALFYLLTLYCATRRGKWQVAAAGCCALGVASKPVAATAPLVVLLYDRAFLSKSFGRALRNRPGLYAGLAATWLLLPVLLANGAKEWKPDAGFGFGGVTAMQYAASQPGVILHYLKLACWPRPLCLDYGWPVARTVMDIVPALIVVGALVAGMVWAWRQWPWLGFVGASFFVI